MDFVTSTDGILNGGLSTAFYVPLGASNTVKFVNFTPGDVITVKLAQDATGSRTVTWGGNVQWQTTVPPTLKTAPYAVDILQFSYDGTNISDISGSPSRLPNRIQSAALGTVVGVVLAGTAVLTLISSGGNGQRPGPATLPDIAQYKTGSAATALTVGRLTASGQLVLGQSGALVIGSPILSSTGSQAKFYADKLGNVTAKGTLSGATLKENVAGAGIGQAACFKTGGSIGYCSTTPTSGSCTCN